MLEKLWHQDRGNRACAPARRRGSDRRRDAKTEARYWPSFLFPRFLTAFIAIRIPGPAKRHLAAEPLASAFRLPMPVDRALAGRSPIIATQPGHGKDLFRPASCCAKFTEKKPPRLRGLFLDRVDRETYVPRQLDGRYLYDAATVPPRAQRQLTTPVVPSGVGIRSGAITPGAALGLTAASSMLIRIVPVPAV